MSVTRITGISSGIDTDSIIKKLLDIDQMRVDKVKQEKQYAIWEQEAYREIYSKLSDFSSKNFDVLNPTTNITSTSFFNNFDASITVNGVDTNVITASGTADMTSFNHTINSITQLATKDKYDSTVLNFNKVISGDLVTDFSANKPAVFKTSLTIDSVSKTLEIDMSTISDINAFKDALNTEISSKFGSDFNDVVTVNGNNLEFQKIGNDLTFLAIDGEESSMTWIGIDSGDSTISYKNETLFDSLGITDADLSNMTIDGVSLSSISITQDTSISDMISLVNGNTSNAKISYNALDDKFEIISLKEGSANSLTLSADFTSKLKFDGGVHTAAQNAKLNIDGVDVIKSTNDFTIDGVSYSIKDTYTGVDPIDISISKNTDAIFDKIKDFVDSYNETVEMLNEKINEKVYRDYKPLTDDQKKAMSEDEIKLWEEKSKSGILRSKSELINILTNMRNALYEDVEGAGISLYEIGITTSKNYKDGGKLVIDESKLKEKLVSDYSKIVKLFTSESDKKYLDTANISERYTENGLGNRLKDILNDNIRLIRDDNGKKGILVEKAGTDEFSLNSSNTIGREIDEYQSRIEDLLEWLNSKEDKYYEQFGKMEAALAEMQSQSDAFFSQLGGLG